MDGFGVFDEMGGFGECLLEELCVIVNGYLFEIVVGVEIYLIGGLGCVMFVIGEVIKVGGGYYFVDVVVVYVDDLSGEGFGCDGYVVVGGVFEKLYFFVWDFFGLDEVGGIFWIDVIV